ncbi:MAG: MFS transporter [Haloarculaceae archaeon]
MRSALWRVGRELRGDGRGWVLVFVAGGWFFVLGTRFVFPALLPEITTAFALSNTFADRNCDSTAIALTFAAGSPGSAALPFVGGRLASAFDWRAGFAAVLVPFLLVSVGLGVPPRVRLDGREGRRTVGSARRGPSRLDGYGPLRAARVGRNVPLAVRLPVGDLLSPHVFPLGEGAPDGALGDRFGRRRVLVSLAGVGTVPLALLPFGYGLPVLAALAVFLGVCLGLGPVNNAYIADAFPSDVQDAGYGFVRTFHMAIGSTGAVIIGYLADASLFDEAFLLLAGLSLVSMVLCAGLPATDTG